LFFFGGSDLTAIRNIRAADVSLIRGVAGRFLLLRMRSFLHSFVARCCRCVLLLFFSFIGHRYGIDICEVIVPNSVPRFPGPSHVKWTLVGQPFSWNIVQRRRRVQSNGIMTNNSIASLHFG
jgi:hypothetical protein